MKIPQEYEVLQKENIADIQSEGWLLRHKKSGARILLLVNQDDNKVFHISFRTTPSDSTGVAHILEHSVLCGSRQFPLKDPFVELVKGSLNTFLNAMTYPDKTMYPVASCNDRDFQNLIHVYMDAVFYPNIYRHEEIFRQEGWSYQMESKEKPLTYNGVVYNEMKGVFSSAEELLSRRVFDTLFPDTTYGVESGGDPEDIPNLTYEQFLEFHRTYYHPSNSYIYLYGDMDMEEKLVWMDREYLSHFDLLEMDSRVKRQKPFEKMAELVLDYPIGEEEEEEENTYLSFSVVTGEGTDVEQNLAFQVLEYVLLNAPGAPLKQALLDAGLGKDVFGDHQDGIYQTFFSVTVKNSELEKKEEFLQVIRETLEELVKNGLNKSALRAGINSMEFKFREADYASFPKGLMYGIDVMDSWLYDDEKPFAYLKQLDVYDSLKKKAEEDYFEQLIRKYLLNNPHSAFVAAVPKKGMAAAQERLLEEKLAAKKASMTEEEQEAVIRKTKELKDYQKQKESPEALASIPMLSRNDIKKEAVQLCNELRQIGETKVLFHNIATNGIAYLTLLFDMERVPDEMIPYLGLLKSVLGYVDTENFEYSQLHHEINEKSGGIYCGLHVFENAEKENDCRRMFGVKAKCLYEQMDFVFSMIREIICTSKVCDEKRLAEIISRQRSRLESSLQESGHISAVYRSSSYFSSSAAFQERTLGISYYRFVADLEKNFEEKKEMIFASLQKLIHMIFRPEYMMVSLTAEESGYQKVETPLEQLKKELFCGVTEAGSYCFTAAKKREGFKTSGQVQYVALSGNFRTAGMEYNGAFRILRNLFGYDYLWNNIRVEGGAYGCMCSFKRNGDSYLVSYRDPNLRKTLQVYENAAAFLRDYHADEKAMTKNIIGTISEMDTPLTPSGKGALSLNAYLCGVTQEMIQKDRDQVLAATDEDIRKLADALDAIVAQKNICVVGSENAIEEAKDLFMTVEPLVK